MKAKKSHFPARGTPVFAKCHVISREKRVTLDLASLQRFAHKLCLWLRLGGRWFDVTLVGNPEIMRLNATFRGKAVPTDVLSFPWEDDAAGLRLSDACHRLPRAAGCRNMAETLGGQKALSGFLGDIVISPVVARQNAKREGHSVEVEIRELVLHGLLHLLGYDHENDHGEMATLELSLRRELHIE